LYPTTTEEVMEVTMKTAVGGAALAMDVGQGQKSEEEGKEENMDKAKDRVRVVTEACR
jgi:hypothetical protein